MPYKSVNRCKNNFPHFLHCHSNLYKLFSKNILANNSLLLYKITSNFYSANNNRLFHLSIVCLCLVIYAFILASFELLASFYFYRCSGINIATLYPYFSILVLNIVLVFIAHNSLSELAHD